MVTPSAVGWSCSAGFWEGAGAKAVARKPSPAATTFLPGKSTGSLENKSSKRLCRYWKRGSKIAGSPSNFNHAPTLFHFTRKGN